MKAIRFGLGAFATVLLTIPVHAAECKAYPRMASGQDAALRRAADGSMWYASLNDNRIVRVDEKFQETPFVPVDGSTNGLTGLVLDDSGNVWFAKSGGRVIGKFPAAGGEGVEYALPEDANYPQTLIRGPDRALWYFDSVHQKLGRVAADGSVTVVPPPPKLNPFGPVAMTSAADNFIWISDRAQNALWKLDVISLKYKRYDIPQPTAHPAAIRVAPDGTVWFTMTAARKLGRLSSSGVFTSIDTAPATPRGLHIADDGTLWFNDDHSTITHIKADGTLEKFKCGAMFGPMAQARDGNIWALGNGNIQVLRLSSVNPPKVATTATIPGISGKVRNVTLAELQKLFADKTQKIVVHYTAWENKGCGHCDGSFAIFEDFARRNAGKATFVRLAGEYNDPLWKDPWLAQNADLKGLPSFITYYDQQEVARVKGKLSAEVLNARLLPAL